MFHFSKLIKENIGLDNPVYSIYVYSSNSALRLGDKDKAIYRLICHQQKDTWSCSVRCLASNETLFVTDKFSKPTDSIKSVMLKLNEQISLDINFEHDNLTFFSEEIDSSIINNKELV